jgi:tRNA (guanine-N7-)-methyltransferase
VQAFFPEPHHPFVIDVGTGKGNWALNYGIANPGVNILGLEIRGSAVELARDRAQRLKVTNVAYLACNANVDIGRILQNISTVSRVSLVAIQFPDPHFKKRQKKRRLVNPSFVATLARGLTPGSEVFFQSDVEELILDANYVFSQCIDFLPNPTFDFSDFGRNQNPLKIMTDREISVVHRGEPVYRMSYLRCRN